MGAPLLPRRPFAGGASSSFANSSQESGQQQSQTTFASQAIVQALLEPETGIGKDLSEGLRSELSSLGQEKNPEIFWQDLYAFAGRLERADRHDAAAGAYSFLVAQNLSTLSANAQARLDAILGKGAFGGRFEFLLNRFAKDASDPKTILPMIAGSTIFSLARGATLSRLAACAGESWLTRGIGARFAAASVGFAAEVPTFALSARALRQIEGAKLGPDETVTHDLASAAITLGFLKTTGALSGALFKPILQSPGLKHAEALQFLASQSTMFLGMLGAHSLEEKLGLRAHVDGATTVTDTLASMLSLGVGSHLGAKFLGEGFAASQREVEIRVKTAEQRLEQPRGTKRWWRNPFLAPAMMMMGNGGIGGFFQEGDEELPRTPHAESKEPSGLHVLKGKREYAGTNFEITVQSKDPLGNRARVVEDLQESLLDILTLGEEEGTPLSGALAEQLRGDGKLRHLFLRLNAQVRVQFDADARKVLAIEVFEGENAGLRLVDPSVENPIPAPMKSGIQSHLPPPPRVPTEARLTEGPAAKPAAPPPAEVVVTDEPRHEDLTVHDKPVHWEFAKRLGYRKALDQQLIHLERAGKTWETVRGVAQQLIEDIYSKELAQRSFTQRQAASNLFFILSKQAQGFSTGDVLELLAQLSQALAGKISMQAVYEARQEFVPAHLRKPVAEVEAERPKSPSPPTVSSMRAPSHEIMMAWHFFAQGKPLWGETAVTARRLLERVQADSKTPEELEQNLENLTDVLSRMLDLAKENPKMTPRRATRWLEEFGKALEGRMSWEEFDGLDPLRPSQNPAGAAGSSTATASPSPSEPPFLKIPKPVEPALLVYDDTSNNPAGQLAISADPAPRTQRNPRDSRTLPLSPLQRVVLRQVMLANRRVQGKDILSALREANTSMNPKTMYSSLDILEERGYLTSTRENNPTPGFPALRYYSLLQGAPIPAELAGPMASPAEVEALVASLAPKVEQIREGQSEGEGAAVTRTAVPDGTMKVEPSAEVSEVLPEVDVSPAAVSVEVPNRESSAGDPKPVSAVLSEEVKASPKPAQENLLARKLVRQMAEGKGLLGLGSAFKLFGIAEGSAGGVKQFQAHLTLPNMDRVIFQVETGNDGQFQVLNEGKGRWVSWANPQKVSPRVEKVEGYRGRLKLVNDSGFPEALTFDLVTVHDRSGATRLELAANQPNLSGEASQYFPSYPLGLRGVEVLHTEQTAFATNRSGGGVHKRYRLHLSNGDSVELLFNMSHHSKGRYELKEAYLRRPGFAPDEAIPLDARTGESGRGGKNKVVLQGRDFPFLIDLDCEMPYGDVNGGIVFAKQTVVEAPAPIYLMFDKPAEGAKAGQDEVGGESGAEDRAQNGPDTPIPPSQRTWVTGMEKEFLGLASEILGGDVESLWKLARHARHFPQALRELLSVYDIAAAPDAKAGDFDGIDPKEMQREIARSLGEIVLFQPEAFEPLLRAHREGVTGALQSLINLADFDESSQQVVIALLGEEAVAGNLEALAGLAHFASAAKSAVLRTFSQEAVRKATIEPKDFGKEDLEFLEKIASFNLGAQKILEERVPNAAPKEAAPQGGPPSAAPQPKPVLTVEKVTVPAKRAAPAKAAPTTLQQFEQLARNALKGSKKKVSKRIHYKAFLELVPKMTQEERLAAARRHVPMFAEALRGSNIRAKYMNLDALHALAHYLDNDGHREIADRLLPLQRLVDQHPGMISDFNCLLVAKRLAELVPPLPPPKDSLGIIGASEDLSMVEGILTLMKASPTAELARYDQRLEASLAHLSGEDLKALVSALAPQAHALASQFLATEVPTEAMLHERAVMDRVLLKALDHLSPELAALARKSFNLP